MAGSAAAKSLQEVAEEIEVPPWVPPELRSAYRRIAAADGEEAAAALARRAKAGEDQALPDAPVPPPPAARNAVPVEREGATPGGAAVSDAGDGWWTERRVELLRKLWGQRASAADIARELGATRNQVLGKIWRLKLTRNEAPRQRTTRTPIPAKAATPVKPAKPIKAPVAVAAPPRAPRPAEPGPEGGIGIVDLQARHCRWIVAGERDEARYCGATKPDLMKPYCAAHAARAYGGQTRIDRSILAAVKRG